jgi:hypothetical protein
LATRYAIGIIYFHFTINYYLDQFKGLDQVKIGAKGTWVKIREQKKFERLKNEKAKSTSDKLGEDVKYVDLIGDRFATPSFS